MTEYTRPVLQSIVLSIIGARHYKCSLSEKKMLMHNYFKDLSSLFIINIIIAYFFSRTLHVKQLCFFFRSLHARIASWISVGQAVFPFCLIKREDVLLFLFCAGFCLNFICKELSAWKDTFHVFDVSSPVAYCAINDSVRRNKMSILLSCSKVCISQYVPFLKKGPRHWAKDVIIQWNLSSGLEDGD